MQAVTFVRRTSERFVMPLMAEHRDSDFGGLQRQDSRITYHIPPLTWNE